MPIEFEDYSAKVKDAMDDAIIAFLYEAGGELESQSRRNSAVGKVGGGQTKGSYSYKVDEGKGEVRVGSPLENAIWEEFGTGEHALHGDGRKGGWYIPIGSGGISEAVVEAYGFKVVEGKHDKKFAFTRGKKPKRPMFKAFEAKKNKLIKRFAQILQNKIGG